MADSGGPHLHHHPHRLSGLAARKGRLPEGSRREQVIGTLKAAFVPGRHGEDEFEAAGGPHPRPDQAVGGIGRAAIHAEAVQQDIEVGLLDLLAVLGRARLIILSKDGSP